MGLTSAAEAKLDARVRPQISALRSRTSYLRRRSEAESRLDPPSTTGSRESAPQAEIPSGVVSLEAARVARTAAVVEPLATRAVGQRPADPRESARSSLEPAHSPRRPAPIRLTRRGRIVVGVLIAIGVGAVAGAIWLAVAGQAQASSQAMAGRRATGSVARLVVKPGQTLWSIAAQVDPGSDPRTIIPQIIEMNSLTSTTIDVGQVLWVPKG